MCGWRRSRLDREHGDHRPSLYNLLKRDKIQEQLAGWHALGWWMVGSWVLTDKQGNGILWRQATPHRKLTLSLFFNIFKYLTPFKKNFYQWNIFYKQRKRKIILFWSSGIWKTTKGIISTVTGTLAPNQHEDKSHSEHLSWQENQHLSKCGSTGSLQLKEHSNFLWSRQLPNPIPVLVMLQVPHSIRKPIQSCHSS